MRTRTKLPTPAMIVALIALIVATTGVGYAATKINGSQIKTASIAGKKLKKDTIKSKQIKDGGVKGKDIAAGVIPTVPPITPEARAFRAGADVTLTNNPTFITVGTVAPLSAGDYMLTGKAQVEPDPLGGTDGAQVICRITVDGVEVDRSRMQIGENTSTATTLRGTIPVLTAAAVPEGGSVALQCAKGGVGISIDASERSLVAVKVDLP